MTKRELIIKAIEEKKQVVGIYDGQWREFCPHKFGTTSGEGRLLVFQFNGLSNTQPGLVHGQWRCLRLDKLVHIKIRVGEWHTAPTLGKKQTCIKEIIKEVK